MRPNFADLIETQLSALFIRNSHGRLRYIREPGYAEAELDSAPRFFMSRSSDRNIWSFHENVPQEILQSVQQLCQKEPPPTEFTLSPKYADEIRTILAQQVPISVERRGPAYWIPEQSRLSEDAVLITEENAGLLNPHFPWKISSPANFRASPVIATVVSGEAVSICFCARITNLAAEAGVVTADAHRGQGYAGMAVAKWAEIVRRIGIIPLYSTSWENTASQNVAKKLGSIMYGDNWSVT